MNEVEVLEIVKESRCLSILEGQQEQVLLEKLEGIHKQEEIYWRQQSRLLWQKEGDENTKFFHLVGNGCKNQNFIPSIQHNGIPVTNIRNSGNIFATRFQQ